MKTRTKTLFLLLFTLLSTLTAGAENYLIWLGSTQVTSENKDNILDQVDANNQPTAKYDPDTETLTLNNPTINGSPSEVIPVNGIDAKILSRYSLKIKGSYHMSENEQVAYGFYTGEVWFDGDFTFYGSSCGVYVEEIVYMLSGSLKAIGGDYGLQSYGFDFLGVTEVNIELKGTVKACNSPTISFDDVAVLLSTPEDGFYDRENNQFYESDGTTIAKHVIFSTSFSYNIWLGETEVTRENMDNIFGDLGEPTATFDGHTLTLNNPTITGVHTFGRNHETAIIYSEKNMEFRVVGTYHQSEATAQYGIWCNSSHFYLGGDFTFRGTEYGLYAKQRCILLTNRYTVNLSMFGETGAMYCPNFLQYDYLSKYLIYDSQGGRLHYDSPYFRDADENIAKGARTMKWDILMVGSTEVLPENCDDILGDGKASYDPETKTLTLDNPTIPGYDWVQIINGSPSGGADKIYAERMDLTIKGSYHMDREEIQHGIYVNHGSLTLDGDFTFLGSSGGILSGGDITVKSGSLTAVGMSDLGTGDGIFANSLTVEDGVDFVDLQGGNYPLNLYYGGGLHLAEGYAITTPENGIFQNNVIYHSDGTTIAKSAVIQDATNPIQFYDLWVGSKRVTSLNQNNILGDGKASFDPTTYTLALQDNPTIPGISNRSKIFSKLPSLTITGSYHMTEEETQSGIRLDIGSLTLNGDFTFLSKGYWFIDYDGDPILNAGNPIWVAGDITLNGDITAEGHDLSDAAICTRNGNITVQGGKLQANGNGRCAAYCGGTFTAKGSAESITLEGLPSAIRAADLVFDNAPGEQMGITQPQNAFFVSPYLYRGVAIDGDYLYAYKVLLSQPRIYNLWVGGTRVNADTRDNILGDGTMSFDPATNTLTLDHPTQDVAIRSEGIDLTVKGVYQMSDAAGDVALDVVGGSLTLEGDFTLRGAVNGVQTGGNMNVKGQLQAYGTSGSGIRYTGTGNAWLTLQPGFFGTTRVEMQGGDAALSYTESNVFRITTNGYELSEPADGIISSSEDYFQILTGGVRATRAVVTLAGTANGEGTELSPFQINSSDDWTKACADVANGCETAGQYFVLNSNITASAMMGRSDNPFAGVIDGQRNFFTVTAAIDQEVEGAALFRAVSGATIKNFLVEGTINGGVVIGGIVGQAVGGTTTMENSVFNGTVSATTGTPAGNFVVGDVADGATVTYTNCLDVPHLLWPATDSRAYTLTGVDATLTLTGSTGIAWNNAIYAPADATVEFTMSKVSNGAYVATSGTLAENDGTYSLIMPAENVAIVPSSAVPYAISCNNPTGGSVDINKTEAPAGTPVYVTATPDAYYLVGTITVKDASDNELPMTMYEDGFGFFTMPSGPVTVTVTFNKKYSFDEATGELRLLRGDFNSLSGGSFGSDVTGNKVAVLKVTAAEGVRFTQSCSQLFKDFVNCTEMDLSKVNTSAMTHTTSMFAGCTNLQKLNMTGWETYQINYMNSMFEGCSSLREIDLSGFHVSEGTSMTRMFGTSGISKLTLPAGMAVTKEMELNKGRTYTNIYEGSWSNGTWSYSGWTVLGANGEVVSTVEADDNNSNFTYAVIPAPPVAMTFVWKDMPDDFILELPDGQDNSKTIADWNGIRTSVQLTGRKLYKDGGWNTICLPFMALTSVIRGAFGTIDEPEIIRLSTDYYALRDDGNGGSYYECSYGPIRDEENGFIYCTGFDETTGTLSLFFEPSSYEIMPGTPYLIKWDNTSGIIESPTFSNVTIDISSDDANVSKTVTSLDGKVSFVGTYDPISFTSVNRSVLFMGGGSNLYYPDGTAPTTIGAFRAYFQLNGISAGNISATRLFFGDGDGTQGIVSMEDVRGKMSDVWYDLNGRKLNGRPTCAGLYIVNGKKVIIK